MKFLLFLRSLRRSAKESVPGFRVSDDSRIRCDRLIPGFLTLTFQSDYTRVRTDEVYEAMRKSVRVSVEPKTRNAERIQIQKRHVGSKGSFAEGRTIDQLIAEQGVQPISELSALSGVLPDDELDEMVADIYSNRTA